MVSCCITASNVLLVRTPCTPPTDPPYCQACHATHHSQNLNIWIIDTNRDSNLWVALGTPGHTGAAWLT